MNGISCITTVNNSPSSNLLDSFIKLIYMLFPERCATSWDIATRTIRWKHPNHGHLIRNYTRERHCLNSLSRTAKQWWIIACSGTMLLERYWSQRLSLCIATSHSPNWTLEEYLFHRKVRVSTRLLWRRVFVGLINRIPLGIYELNPSQM